VVERLPRKGKALGSVPSSKKKEPQKKKKKKREGGREGQNIKLGARIQPGRS